MSRKSLGRGLAALIPAAEVSSPEEGVHQIEVSRVTPNPYQPRKTFDPEKLQELVQSIRAHGIVQPIVVTRSKEGYRIVVGERRWRAAMEAGLTTIPAMVKDLPPKDQMELALVENLQREDLNPIEEAEGCHRLMMEFGLTQEELSERVGKSRSAVANSLRLLALPMQVKGWLIDGKLSAGHGRALLALDGEATILQVAEMVLKAGLSVRQTEALVRKQLEGSVKKRKTEELVDYSALRDLERRLQLSLGTRVQILAREGNRGTIELHYFSQDDFTRIVTALFQGTAGGDGEPLEVSLL